MINYTREELINTLRSWVTADQPSNCEKKLKAAADMLEQDGAEDGLFLGLVEALREEDLSEPWIAEMMFKARAKAMAKKST